MPPCDIAVVVCDGASYNCVALKELTRTLDDLGIAVERAFTPVPQSVARDLTSQSFQCPVLCCRAHKLHNVVVASVSELQRRNMFVEAVTFAKSFDNMFYSAHTRSGRFVEHMVETRTAGACTRS